ncbi:MAG: GNAT family N-acetyltransferase, partial [Erysipelotrichaceae bacterium]|nr:GNAT family N-acetyltransferase [Erysipelotrichaceae bacterium]
MIFRLAEKNDLEALYLFYNVVIDQQKFDEYTPAWTKDVYPSKEDLLRHLQEDKVYLIEENDEIIASGIISLKEDPIYKGGPWTKMFEDDEIAVLHLFAVHPKCRRRGLALDLLKHIIEETKKTSKAIHMDVVKGNKGAY